MRLAQRMIGGAFIAGGITGIVYSITPNISHPCFCFGLAAIFATWGGILANEGCRND